MGLFDFFKNTSGETKKNAENKNVQYLNEIQKEVHKYLKPLGFKKKGRTFNRQTDNGVWQVINFQSGKFPVGENYEIPGIRESLYGKFTINMGVIVKELYESKIYAKDKDFYQEYDCQIRTRLSNLIYSNDYWWNITNDSKHISDQIVEGLNDKGIPWFSMFETREKICGNWGNVDGSSKSAKLDVALIIFHSDKKKGEELMQEYFDSIKGHKGHKEYVKELAKQFDIKLTDNDDE